MTVFGWILVAGLAVNTIGQITTVGKVRVKDPNYVAGVALTNFILIAAILVFGTGRGVG